jgi:hypothetical protein
VIVSLSLTLVQQLACCRDSQARAKLSLELNVDVECPIQIQTMMAFWTVMTHVPWMPVNLIQVCADVAQQTLILTGMV